MPCGDCRFCRDGAYWMCEPHAIYGFKRRVNGAMAEYMVFTRQSRSTASARSPPTTPPSPSRSRARCGRARPPHVRGRRRRRRLRTDRARHDRRSGRQVGRAVVALDRNPARLDLAQTGATDVIDVTSVDPIETVKAMTGGYGGRVLRGDRPPDAVGQGLQLAAQARPLRRVQRVRREASVDWTIVGDDKELDILGAHLGPHCWPKAIELIEHDALPLDGICSHQLPLARFEEAFELVASADRSVKVTLLP